VLSLRYLRIMRSSDDGPLFMKEAERRSDTSFDTADTINLCTSQCALRPSDVTVPSCVSFESNARWVFPSVPRFLSALGRRTVGVLGAQLSPGQPWTLGALDSRNPVLILRPSWVFQILAGSFEALSETRKLQIMVSSPSRDKCL